MYWANFLHIYQPPTQTEAITRKVAGESYRTLVRVLESSPGARITLNINAVLTEQLARFGLSDVIEGLKRLAQKGQVELTGSAMFHPILPLIPRDEVERQIQLNSEINRRYFGEVYRPRGFFPPEMCYSRPVAEAVARMGFEWIIIDEIAFNGKFGQARDDTLYSLAGDSRLHIFFKERRFSAGITYGQYPHAPPFLSDLKSKAAGAYLLTGTDGEIYGHHRPGQEKLLEEVFQSGEPQTCTISDLFKLIRRREEVDPQPSSWSTWQDEMAHNIPFPQWDYPAHPIHLLQWQLARLSLDLVKSVSREKAGFAAARSLLDQGLHSDQFWWASCRPWWNTGMIEAGARQLLDSVELLAAQLPAERVEEAGRLFRSIIDTARAWQQSGEAARRKADYLREHEQVTSELTFGQGPSTP